MQGKPEKPGGDLALAAAQLVHSALHGPDLRRLYAAAGAMPKAGLDLLVAAVDGLRAGLRHDNPLVRRRAAQALAFLKEVAAPALDDLIAALDDSEWTVREAVVQALAALPFVERAVLRAELVGHALHDRSPLV